MAKITPHVFISAASDDLRSARQVVKNSLLTIGCYPVVQEHFEPDYRTVKEMIRGRIEDCHAVVHLIGKRYGGEPSPVSLPPGELRRSWTQMEFHIARELGRKTFLFICDESYPFDIPSGPEPDDEVELQKIYREEILTGEQLYIVVKSPEELALRISELKLEAAELREEVEKARNQLSDALVAMERSSGQLKSGQSKILAGLADLSFSFSELAELGGVIPDPKSPEQFYHNARLCEMTGDYGNARRAYQGYFQFDLDFLDPHLRFQDFLKIQEGLEGARETYQLIEKRSSGSICNLASALLWDRSLRVKKIDQFLETHPDFGPAWYILSEDFSAVRLGSQSLSDKRREKEALEKFQEFDANGKVVRWILDQGEVARWRADAEARLAALETSAYAIENPVSVYWMNHNTGWTGTIQIAEMTKEIFWKPPGADQFSSTGFSEIRSYSTGLPHPNGNIELPKDAKRGSFEIKYRNLAGVEMGPFTDFFDPLEEFIAQTKQVLNVSKSAWLAFREYDGKLLLYFTHLLTYRNGLSSIRYGLDIEIPNCDYPFSSDDEPTSAGIDPDLPIYIEVPEETKFATVVLRFKDETETEVVRINRS